MSKLFQGLKLDYWISWRFTKDHWNINEKAEILKKYRPASGNLLFIPEIVTTVLSAIGDLYVSNDRGSV